MRHTIISRPAHRVEQSVRVAPRWVMLHWACCEGDTLSDCAVDALGVCNGAPCWKPPKAASLALTLTPTLALTLFLTLALTLTLTLALTLTLRLGLTLTLRAGAAGGAADDAHSHSSRERLKPRADWRPSLLHSFLHWFFFQQRQSGGGAAEEGPEQGAVRAARVDMCAWNYQRVSRHGGAALWCPQVCVCVCVCVGVCVCAGPGPGPRLPQLPSTRLLRPSSPLGGLSRRRLRRQP